MDPGGFFAWIPWPLAPQSPIIVFASSQGLEIQGFYVPAFEIGPGSILNLKWPLAFGGPIQNVLINGVTGKSRLAGLEVVMGASISDPFSSELSNIVPSKFCKEASLSFPHPLDAKVEQFGQDLCQRFEELPLTPRFLMALFSACRQSKFVVTWLSGLDPIGESQGMKALDEFAACGFGFLVFQFPLMGLKSTSVATIESLR